MKLQITREARRDWQRILRYLRQKFGPATEQQAVILLEQLFASLLLNPGKGRAVRSGAYPDLRVCVLKKSLVFYRASDDVIRIVRIMDAAKTRDVGWRSDCLYDDVTVPGLGDEEFHRSKRATRGLARTKLGKGSRAPALLISVDGAGWTRPQSLHAASTTRSVSRRDVPSAVAEAMAGQAP